MLRENKSEKHGQCIQSFTMTTKPEVRWRFIVKRFVCERTYDKVESDCAICSLILTFILILVQKNKNTKKQSLSHNS